MSVTPAVTLMTLDLDELRGFVADCRDGQYSDLDLLTGLLNDRQVTHGDLESSPEEVERFIQCRIEQDREQATQYLTEARAGNLENMSKLVNIISRWPSIQTWLRLPSGEYRDLARQCNLRTAAQVLKECREGNRQNLGALLKILELEELRPEDLGIDPKEFVILTATWLIDRGREDVARCRQGDFSGLLELLKSIERKALHPEEIGSTEAELKGFRRTYFTILMNQVAGQCREDDFRRLESLKATFDGFQGEPLPDLDFTVGDLERWLRMAQLLGRNRTPSKLVLTA